MGWLLTAAPASAQEPEPEPAPAEAPPVPQDPQADPQAPAAQAPGDAPQGEPFDPDDPRGVGAAGASEPAEPGSPATGIAETSLPEEAGPTAPDAPAPQNTASPLVPPGEDARMSKRPVEAGTLLFKPGTGLVAESADGDFALGLGLRAQFRYTLEHDNAPGGETEQSFMIRRARVTFTGHVFGENNRFKTELAVSPPDVGTSDGVPTTSPLLDWYFDFVHLRDLSVRVGQYKVPFSRQRVISSGDLQLVDRAITNSEFNVDRDIGLDLRSKDFLGLELLRYYAGIYVGEGRNTFEADDFGMMYIGRVEVLPFGLFEDYAEVDFARTGPRLSLGAAYTFIDNAKRDRGILGSVPADQGTTDVRLFTADAMFKLFGFSLLSELYFRTGDRDPGPLVDDMGMPILDEDGNPITVAATRDGIGFLAQAGYLIPRIPFEIAARYALIRGDDAPGRDALTDEDEVGGGVSYYFAYHQLKIQADYFRLAADQNFSDGADEFRVQLQAAF